jgi:hypothetical protein
MMVPYCDIVNGSTIYTHAPTAIFFWEPKELEQHKDKGSHAHTHGPKDLGLDAESLVFSGLVL